MASKIYAPNVHLFAFHLKDNHPPNLLWDKWNTLLSQRFGVTKPLEIEEKPGYRVDLLKDKTDDDVALHFESKIFLDGTPLPITGLATPLRIHDTYVLALNLRRPEFDENQKKTNPLNLNILELLNPSGCLMPSEIGSSLGQTLLLTVWYTEEKQWLPWKSPQNRQELRQLADNCLREFIPNQYPLPDFYREGQLFGSPIFEYGVPTQEKDYCHILIWVFCETETDDKFTAHYSTFVSLFCHLNKVVAAFHRSRQVHHVVRQEYQAIEPYINTIFQGMPVDKQLTQHELNQFKKYLKDIPQKYLSYSQLISELDRYRLTIDTNAQNYRRELNDIQSKLPAEDISFLSRFLDDDYRLFTEQIQSDLGYFQHGAGLLEKALTAIQGRVDIEQAESDRATESAAQKRQQRLELLIAVVSTGLAVSGISSQVTSEPVKTIITKNQPSDSPEAVIPLYLSYYNFLDVLFHIIVGVLIALPVGLIVWWMQKRSNRTR
ncbi:MAG: hypothetical protein RID53_34080 [Coleofasciculus sp. B1-GNL1-01]|uniref:hypothetical protein n=1 Tax=Coleofasciculus sp. B1-GNL1-01 TaxID=3068484 RepID=UPI0032F5B43F